MLHTLSIIAIVTGVICALIIAGDILFRRRQKMMVMNFVYPITGLYAGPLALLVYFTIGQRGSDKLSYWQAVVKGTLHCGAGCTLADMIVETALLFFPVVLFGRKLYGAWAVDYGAALLIGIVFQYFALMPMRDLSPREGIVEAAKADVLSLTAWQIGMYGWMAIATFLIFNHELKADTPLFWFMMQLAMLLGFVTAYPMNWFLIRSGIKEKM